MPANAPFCRTPVRQQLGLPSAIATRGGGDRFHSQMDHMKDKRTEVFQGLAGHATCEQHSFGPARVRRLTTTLGSSQVVKNTKGAGKDFPWALIERCAQIPRTRTDLRVTVASTGTSVELLRETVVLETKTH